MTIDRYSSPADAKSRLRPASAVDVAKLANVSRATVSNALNHPEKVSAQKLQRVQQAIEQLGYVPSAAARQLRTGRSGTIGLLLLDAWNPSFSDMARGVEDAAIAAGLKLLIANSGRDLEREKDYFRLFNEQRVSGIIVVPHDQTGRQYHQIGDRGSHVVTIDRADHNANRYSVSVDDVLGGQLIAEHLVDLGHRHIAFVGDASAAQPVRERLEGVQRFLGKSETFVRLDIVECGLSIEGGHRAGSKIASWRGKPTAVIAAVDLVAFGVLQAFIQNHVHVPGDVSLCGYDDVQFSEQLSVPLTTVRRPHYDMGLAATSMLQDLIAGVKPNEVHMQFAPELIVRKSTSWTRKHHGESKNTLNP